MAEVGVVIRHLDVLESEGEIPSSLILFVSARSNRDVVRRLNGKAKVSVPVREKYFVTQKQKLLNNKLFMD